MPGTLKNSKSTSEKSNANKLAKKELALAKPKELKTNLKLEVVGKLPKNLASASYLLAEPKSDGLRGIAFVSASSVKLYTAGGVRMVNGPAIVKALQNYTPLMQDAIVIDGEFFSENWNDTSSIVKTLSSDHPKRKQLKFRVFDMLLMAEFDKKSCSESLAVRQAKLRAVCGRLQASGHTAVTMFDEERIKPTTDVIQRIFRRHLKEGHEGTVVKHPESLYAYKRSDSWVKLKPFFSADLKVVNVKEGTGKHKGRLGAFFCEGKIDGKRILTRVGGGLVDKDRDKFWKMHKRGKLLGTIVEVVHEGLTANNAVRFPRYFRQRWDKSQPN